MTDSEFGDVVLAARHKPSLPAGDYLLQVRQSAPGGPGLGVDRRLSVRGARFALTDQDVVATYPAPGAAGDFTLVLPQITLASSVLPWARAVSAGSTTPWMALLVLTQADVQAVPGGEVLTSRTVASLLDDGGDAVLRPRLAATAEERATTCMTVDLKPEALALAPTEAELPWLAHVRTVTGKGDEGPGWEPGHRAVVLANRFPRTPDTDPTRPTAFTAVLVSLEGLPELAVLGAPEKLRKGTASVRLVALKAWTFTATGPGRSVDFRSLASRLAADSRTDDGRLRLPRDTREDAAAPTGAARYVADRLEDGAVPVAWRLATGEDVPAWYRGPLTPVPAAPLPTGSHPFATADEALVYCRSQGVYETGYACAFTLGQLLALADPHLRRAQDTARAQAVRALHQARPVVTAAPPLTTPTAGGAGLPPTTARDRLQALVAREVDTSITNGLTSGTNRPLPPSAAPPTRGAPVRDLIAAVTRPRCGNAAETTADVRAASRAVAAVAVRHAPGIRDLMPATTAQRLARIPFHLLVPHEAMLPEHSIRFFHVDTQWLRAVDDGMLHAGVVTALDKYLAGLLGLAPAPPQDGPGAGETGCLIRSPLVSAWPDLLVSAFNEDRRLPVEASRPLPDVLMLLFPGDMPSRLVLGEPPHGLATGIDGIDGTVILRVPQAATINGRARAAGESLGDEGIHCTVATRPSTDPLAKVLSIHDGTGTCLSAAVAAAYADNNIPHKDPLGSETLALQLVNGAASVEFTPDNPTRTP